METGTDHESRPTTVPFTLLVVAAVLFGIPRVAAAGFPIVARGLYAGVFGAALFVLSINLRTLRSWR
jgi:hypothetical protein